MASYGHGPIGVEILFSQASSWGAMGGVAVTQVDVVEWTMKGLGRAYCEMLGKETEGCLRQDAGISCPATIPGLYWKLSGLACSLGSFFFLVLTVCISYNLILCPIHSPLFSQLQLLLPLCCSLNNQENLHSGTMSTLLPLPAHIYSFPGSFTLSLQIPPHKAPLVATPSLLNLL